MYGKILRGGAKPLNQGASSLLGNILKLHMRTYIKGKWDFLRTFPRSIKHTADLCDTESLYTSNYLDLGVNASEHWIDIHSNLIPDRFTKEFILEFAVFILTTVESL